jgi:hypothetical protein
MDQLVISLKEITTKEAEERIPLACCSFDRYLHCSTKRIEQYCPNDPSAVNYIGNKMIKGNKACFYWRSYIDQSRQNVFYVTTHCNFL